MAIFKQYLNTAMPEIALTETGEERRIRRLREGKAQQKQRNAEKKAKEKSEKDAADQQILTQRALNYVEMVRKLPKTIDVNDPTALRNAARNIADVALYTLVQICTDAKNENARVSASREILDRGFGKSCIWQETDASPASEITVVFPDADTSQG